MVGQSVQGRQAAFWKAGSGFKSNTSLNKAKGLAFDDEVRIDKEGSPQNHNGSVCRLAGKADEAAAQRLSQVEGQDSAPWGCSFIPSTVQGGNLGTLNHQHNNFYVIGFVFAWNQVNKNVIGHISYVKTVLQKHFFSLSSVSYIVISLEPHNNPVNR